MNAGTPIYIVRARFDAARLAREVSRTPNLGDLDVGYLIHWGLRRALGDVAPSPFRVMGTEGRWTEVLGYASQDASALVERGRSRGEVTGCDWDSLRTKVLPLTWPAGQRLRFEVRCCPVVRLAKPVAGHRAGAEVDAFLSECWRAGASGSILDRRDVYTHWLSARCLAAGASSVQSVTLDAFQRERLFRRTQGALREGRRVERPDVLLRGTLRVEDPARFGAWLLHGVGRHRAFGYGMVLLRPA